MGQPIDSSISNFLPSLWKACLGESEDGGPKHTERETKWFRVHPRLGIDSVNVPEGKTDREDGLILPTLRQIERPPSPVCMNLSSYKKDASS